MAAEYVDALLGYEYFLEKRGKVTRDQINDYLTSNGRKTIHHRTYTHYKKLIENGFRSYVPINKFDVFQALGKLEIAADRRRYHREKRIEQINISRDRKEWVKAVLTDQSMVGFGIVSSRFPVRPGTQIWVQIKDYLDIPVIVVWRKHESGFTRMGIRALEFISKYRLLETEKESTLPRGHLTITRSEDDKLSWENLYRILSKTNELLVASNDLIYVVADQSKTEIRLATPIIESIKFGSPGLIDILTALGVSGLLKVVFDHLSKSVLDKRHYLEEIRNLKLENNGIDLDNRRKEIEIKQYEIQITQENARRSIENTNLMIETMRNAFKLINEIQDKGITGPFVEEIKQQLAGFLDLPHLPSGAFAPGTLERSILEKRILPPAAELIGGDDPGFQINPILE